jgi:hypothetical protein
MFLFFTYAQRGCKYRAISHEIVKIEPYRMGGESGSLRENPSDAVVIIIPSRFSGEY